MSPPYFYPRILAPVDMVNSLLVPARKIHNDVVLRNLTTEELDDINEVIQIGSPFGIGPLTAESLVLEIKANTLPTFKSEKDEERTRRIADGLVGKALTLLRLANAGPIGIRFFVYPMTNAKRPEYGFFQVGFLPLIRLPEADRYPDPDSAETNLKTVFKNHWNRNLDVVPGIRWLEKTYGELHPEDRLAQIVFGLEQLLLRDESERTYLTFKMALRGAYLLAPADETRFKVFADLQRAYSVRSKVAHGTKRTLERDEFEILGRAEDYLRRLILLFLDDEKRFNQKELTRLTLGLVPSP